MPLGVGALADHPPTRTAETVHHQQRGPCHRRLPVRRDLSGHLPLSKPHYRPRSDPPESPGTRDHCRSDRSDPLHSPGSRGCGSASKGNSSGQSDGVRFTYRHRTLRPLALSMHVWFPGNSIVTTTFGVYALRHLGLPDWGFGLVLAAGGVGGFLGALLAPRLGAVLGAGRAILCGRALIVLPWLALALLPLSATMDLRLGLPVAAGALFLSSLAMGIEDTNDISYRQAIAPDEIQGRMNVTIRTANRVVFFFGALATGVLMTLLGFTATIGIGALVFILAAAIALFSPLRTVRREDETDR
jgi:predicted MFS family arabinose efflux permease